MFLAIAWGAVRSLTATSLPIVGDFVAWAQTAPPGFIWAQFLSWIAENWRVFAASYIFFIVVFIIRPAIDELSQTGSYQRIFMGTMMNYFRVQTETESLKKFREEGSLAVMKQGLFERIFYSMLGQKPPDEALEAKAVRAGEEVSLSEDLREAAQTQYDRR
jgi:hypothetical protein